MELYFSSKVSEPFVPFTPVHFITLATLVLINTALAIWFVKARNSMRVQRFGCYLGWFLLVNELFYLAWSLWSGGWSMEYSLPLHLCDAAIILAGIMLIFKSFSAFEIVYFWGLGGALQALLTPDLYYPFPHVIYFNFFLNHSAIITAIAYMISVKSWKPSFSSIIKTFVFTNLYMAVISIVNLATGGNYMFLCSKPENPSILDFLGPWPWYVLSLQGVGLVICLLLYLPFGISTLRNCKNLNFHGQDSFQA